MCGCSLDREIPAFSPLLWTTRQTSSLLRGLPFLERKNLPAREPPSRSLPEARYLSTLALTLPTRGTTLSLPPLPRSLINPESSPMSESSSESISPALRPQP